MFVSWNFCFEEKLKVKRMIVGRIWAILDYKNTIKKLKNTTSNFNHSYRATPESFVWTWAKFVWCSDLAKIFVFQLLDGW